MPTPLPAQPEDEDDHYGAEFDKTLRRSQLWQIDWPAMGFAYSGVYAISQYRSGWPVKIGISCTVSKRLSALQTSQWNLLDVFHYWLCENAASARKVERATHKFLLAESKSMSGEWFDLREHEVPRIVEFIAEKEGIELVKELPKTAKFGDAHKRLADIDERYRRRKERDTQKNIYGAHDISWQYNE